MSRQAKVKTLCKLTASSLIMTALLAGCKPATFAQRPQSVGMKDAGEDLTARLARKLADQAAQALVLGQYDQAIDLAERVVSAAPDDAGYRTQLAQAYLRAGRFVSADQAYADVIRLMPDNDKARVAQAVARIAQGNRSGARAVLADVTNAPADDFGLALALVGDTKKALAVLEPAARGMRGTSRTRQNLALAYALAGQWDKARAVAAQDVSPSEIDRRMAGWASLASPEARNMQVASLLGTKPVEQDPGQPMMLALVQPAPQQAAVEVAQAEPVVAAVPQVVAPASVEQPAARAEAKAATAMIAQPQPVGAHSTEAQASNRPVTPTVAVAVATPVPAVAEPTVALKPVAAATPVSEVRQVALDAAVTAVSEQKPAVAASPKTPLFAVSEPKSTVNALSTTTRVAFEPAPLQKRQQAKGEWAVQLGAYRNERRVEAGWLHLSDKFSRLAQYTPAQSRYIVTATGAQFYRLSVTGFASRASASALCHSIKLKGGDCFVRKPLQAERPIHMVARNRDQLAANY